MDEGYRGERIRARGRARNTFRRAADAARVRCGRVTLGGAVSRHTATPELT